MFATAILFMTMTAPPLVGGYGSASPSDPAVIAAANYAVKAHSEASHKPHRLKAIISAEHQVVAGLNFKMCLKVGEGRRFKHTHLVRAVVYQNLQQELSLSQWEHAPDCAKK